MSTHQIADSGCDFCRRAIMFTEFTDRVFFFSINRARLFPQCIVAMTTCCNHMALLVYQPLRGFLELVRPQPLLFHFHCGNCGNNIVPPSQ